MPADLTALLEQYRRYADLIEPALLPTLAAPETFETESPAALQVERGAALAPAVLYAARNDRDLARRALSEPGPFDRLVHRGTTGGPAAVAKVAVIDRTGHQRPAYRGLLAYAAFQSFRLLYEAVPQDRFGAFEEGLRAWADALEADLTTHPLPETAAQEDASPPAPSCIPAAAGDRAAAAVWSALALHAAGKVFVRDAWTDLASDTFGRLTRLQQASGAFLAATRSDNPETHWYHELVILHAAASYAVQAEDRPLAAAVRRNAAFHQDQTQPDHATHQPWGLFAFVWDPATHPLADQVLHGGTALPGATAGERVPAATPVTLTSILLADALYCLRLFLRPAP